MKFISFDPLNYKSNKARILASKLKVLVVAEKESEKKIIRPPKLSLAHKFVTHLLIRVFHNIF